MVSLGEIGLSGELRSVGYVEKRLEEAVRLGFTRALIPRSAGRKLQPVEGLTFLPARTIREAIRLGLEG
jgi:DNA repair protein RadA/Sms